MDLYGYYGNFIKAASFAYLCHVVVVKHVKIPILFLVLYGLGSLAFLTRLFAIKENSSDLVDACIYEQYVNILLCIIIILYLFKV